jgi:hypothetical protein
MVFTLDRGGNMISEKLKKHQREYGKKYYRAHPEERKEYSRRYRLEHRDTNRAYLKKYRDSHPDYVKENNLKKYGITLVEYNSLSVSQGGKCAICGEHSPVGRRLSVDHDHFTGRVRGLLCHWCNRGIGLLREDENLFLRAILYLRKNKDSC